MSRHVAAAIHGVDLVVAREIVAKEDRHRQIIGDIDEAVVAFEKVEVVEEKVAAEVETEIEGDTLRAPAHRTRLDREVDRALDTGGKTRKVAVGHVRF